MPLRALRDREGVNAREGLLAGAALLAGTVAGYVLRPLLERFVRGRLGRLLRGGGGSEGRFVAANGGGGGGGGSAGEEWKLVLCVRTDLKMSKGKIAAQVGHATLGAYKRALRFNAGGVRRWEDSAQPKIAVQIKSAAEANRLEASAARRGVPAYKVFDAGRTQIAAGSMTVIAVGPGPASLVNEVTGRLKLL